MKFTAYDFIKTWEELRLNSYQDVKGVWTIGWGHTGNDVKKGMSITLEEAQALLENDLSWAVNAVNKYVKVDINQNQFNALVSLTFNIGIGSPIKEGFSTSTCLKRFNNRDYTGAAEALTWWNKSGGKTVKGLINRREAEKEMFLTPVDQDKEIKSLLEEYTNKLITLVRGNNV